MGKIKFYLKSKTHFWPFLLLFVLTIPLLLPLLKPGMFVSDDGGWMIVRLSDFHRSLRDGQFPVRWAGRLNFGYGYPVFNFLYPGTLYLGEMIHLLGFNFISSVKILFGLSIIFSGIFCYFWLKKLFSPWPALVGSFVYLYAPYHLFDIYTRGSLGEAVALAILPLILYLMEKKNIFLIAIFIAVLITSHNTLALIFLPVIFLYGFFGKLFKTYDLIFTFILGFFLSAFFWLPALWDQQDTVFSQVTVSQWQNFFLSRKNFSLLGWESLLLGLGSLLILMNKRDKKALLFLIIFLFSTFLALPLSSVIWQVTPLPKLVQFPWRFLSLTIICLSFLTAFSLDTLSSKIKLSVGILIFVVFFLFSWPHLNQIEYELRNEEFYTTNEDTTTVKREYTPKWVKNFPTNRPEKKVELVSGRGELGMIFQNSRRIVFSTENQTETMIKVNLVYFPGWIAKIDKVDTPIFFDNEGGLISLSVPEGKHEIEVLWEETTLRKLSDILSLVTFMGLTGCLLIRKKVKDA